MTRLDLCLIESSHAVLDLREEGLAVTELGADLLDALADQAGRGAGGLTDLFDQAPSLGGQLGDARGQVPPLGLESAPVAFDASAQSLFDLGRQGAADGGLADALDDEGLDGLGRQRARLASLPAVLVAGHTPVIAVLDPLLPRRRGRHRHAAAGAAEDASQQVLRVSGAAALAAASRVEPRPHAPELFGVDDGVVVRLVELVAVRHVARVEGVLEHAEDGVLGPLPARADVAVVRAVTLRGPARLVEQLGDGQRRAVLIVKAEELTHDDGLELVDDELLVHDVVAERNGTAGPLAAPAGGGDLVARALGDHGPLKFGKAH